MYHQRNIKAYLTVMVHSLVVISKKVAFQWMVSPALTKIWKFEGVRGLQAGLAPMVAFQVAMNGTRLGSTCFAQ